MGTLLIQPFSRLKELSGHGTPLAVCSLAGFLEKQGEKVHILDYASSITKGRSPEEVTRAYLDRHQPDVVGISVMTPMFASARAIASWVRAWRPETRIVVGGPHPSALPEETLHLLGVDAVVRGEGEVTLVELVRSFRQGGALHDIAGLTFVEGDKIVSTPDRPLEQNLDRFGLPARHLVSMDDYDVACLITSRGCPFHCVYCYQLNGPSLRRFSVDHVMAEIEELVHRYHRKTIYFFDDLFAASERRVSEITSAILERGIKVRFRCLGRVTKMTRTMVRNLKAAGCISIHFGVESGDDAILKRIRKQATTANIRETFRLCRDEGMPTVAYFMLGFPWDTRESILRTIDLATELRQMALPIPYMKDCPTPANVQFTLVTPMPKTALWEEAKAQGLLKDVAYEDLVIGLPANADRESYGRKFMFEPIGLTRDDLLDLFELAHARVFQSRSMTGRFRRTVTATMRRHRMGFAVDAVKSVRDRLQMR